MFEDKWGKFNTKEETHLQTPLVTQLTQST